MSLLETAAQNDYLVTDLSFGEAAVARDALCRTLYSTHNSQIDLNKMLDTVKGTHQTSKWTPLGPQISEN